MRPKTQLADSLNDMPRGLTGRNVQTPRRIIFVLYPAFASAPIDISTDVAASPAAVIKLMSGETHFLATPLSE